MTRTIILEQHKRLSDSLIWKKERAYFEEKGVDAWISDVPFYITNNPFIAATYTRIFLHFIREWIRKHPESKNHPFYIMELGTGSGRFSYYVVKAIQEFRASFHLEDVKIVYVMSDLAKRNLEYHETHHALRPLIDQGLIDLAVFDIASRAPIKLMHSGLELNRDTLKNPLLLCANYFFDTLANDSFSVRNGKLYELLVTLTTDESNMHDNKPVDLEKIQMDHHWNEISGPYYKNPELDPLLDIYKNSLTDTNVLIPIESLRGFDYLRELSNDRMLLVSSDKAYSELSSLDHLGYPSMAFHGSSALKCFSMMVNYHAVGNYFINGGGDFFPQTSRRGIKTCAFSRGIKFADFPETHAALQENIENFSPADFFNVRRNVLEAQNVELDAIASLMQLSRWDSYTFLRLNLATRIGEEADAETVEYLARNMHKVSENYFKMPQSDCVPFEVAVFFHAIKYYKDAYEQYSQAEKFVGDQFGLHYNAALCLHHMDRNKEALARFRRALQIDPDSKEAKEWIAYLEKMFVEEKDKPKGL